jgi:hypothetical protein
MGRQRCGSCRFFQEAGLAGSGWCHHPLRKTTSDLLIMVRKNELACRDAWSHSLWEPGKFEDDDTPAEGSDAGVSFAARPVTPASDSDIAAILQASQTTDDAPREDVVLSEVRVLPSAKPEPAADLERAAQYRDLDARSAIIKAREAFRERVRIDTRRIGEPAAPASRVPAAEAREPESDAEEPLSARELDQGWPDDGLAAEAEALDGEEDDVRLAEPEADDDDLLAAEGDDFGPGDRTDDEAFEPEPSPAESWLSRGLFGGFGRFIHLRPVAESRAAQAPAQAAVEAGSEGELEPGPIDATTGATPDRAWDRDPEAIFDAIVDRLPGGEAPPLAIEAESVAAPLDDAPRFGFRPGRTLPAPSNHAAEPEPEAADDWDVAVEPAATIDALEALEDIEVGPGLAPGLPRVCRTCRDFRPSESGGRGWCANRWAFTHRRMVDAQDAAPCSTSFGTWWLPVDEVWSTAYDISGHGQATPLLDAWLLDRRDDEPQRRRS